MEHQQRRRRGEGSIYSKPRSPFLWVKYYSAGKPIRESTRTRDFRKAAQILRQRLAEVGSDPVDSPRIEQLVDDLFRDYRRQSQSERQRGVDGEGVREMDSKSGRSWVFGLGRGHAGHDRAFAVGTNAKKGCEPGTRGCITLPL
jgi:hypothetical protein